MSELLSFDEKLKINKSTDKRNIKRIITQPFWFGLLLFSFAGVWETKCQTSWNFMWRRRTIERLGRRCESLVQTWRIPHHSSGRRRQKSGIPVSSTFWSRFYIVILKYFGKMNLWPVEHWTLFSTYLSSKWDSPLIKTLERIRFSSNQNIGED